jgi:hypothetical protein
MAEKTPERLALEARAAKLEIKVPGNIGDKKLTTRIEVREAEIAAQDKPPVMGSEGGTENGSGPQAGVEDAPADKKPPSRSPKAVTVTGPIEGRRRAGRRFGLEPVEIPLDELSDDELLALKGDPALSVFID